MYWLWCRDCRRQLIFQSIDTISLTMLYAFLFVAGGQVAIPLPLSPVPITLHTLVAFVLPFAVGWNAVLAYGWYLLFGLLGFPVFAFGLGGVDLLMGPSGGYLIGMGLAVVFLACISRFSDSRWGLLLLALLAAEMITVAVGLWQLSFFVDSSGLLQAGLWPFLPGTIYKTVAALISVALVRQVKGALSL